MPTQEERLSTLEQTVIVLGNGIRDLNHHTTILLGVAREQGQDIREMKGSLVALSQRLGAFEHRVDSRFEALDGHVSGLDGRIGALEQRVDSRFEALDGRIGALDGHVSGLDGRIGALEQSVNSRFEEQGKKLDQVLLLLNSVIPGSERET